MIIKKEPKGNTKQALKLSKFFSNKDNTVYPIQSDLQRRYCWPSTHIDKFFKDYIIDLFEKNKEADESGDDCSYAIIGDAILTRVEDNYGHEQNCKKQEIIDMSQRITTVMAFVVVMLYIYMKNNGIIDKSERYEIFKKYLRTKNNKSWKVISTFRDSDFEEVINDCINNVCKFDERSVNSLIKCFKENSTKKNEVKYKSFKSICAYVYNLIDSTIGIDDYQIKERLDLFLDKTHVYVEECEKDDRVAKFKEVNTYRSSIAEKDIYKTLLCAKGDAVDSKFQDFEEKVKSITSKDRKRIHIYKTPISETEYIMKIALIVMDDSRETCKSSFSLGDEKYGIEYQLEKGILSTEYKVLEYLDVCMDICNFLENSMGYSQDGFNEEWYLLTENHNKPFIWQYNILPAYAIHNISNEEKKEFAFIMLLNSFTAYSIKYSTSRSVQYIQTYMYSFAKEILEGKDDSCCIEDFKSNLEHVYNSTFGDFIANECTKAVKSLSYSHPSSKPGIYAILSYFEYLAQKKCNRKRDNLYHISVNGKENNGEIEIDHVFPRSNENEKNEGYIDSIGNLVFLEKSLNGSKQNDESSSSERYTDSSFISTKLMIDGNRYEGLSNEECEAVREKVIPYHKDKDTINNFEEHIEYRRNEIALRVKSILTNKI